MDVFDHGVQCRRIEDIAIITAASLPEAMVHFTVGLFVAESFEKIRGLSTKKGQSLPLDRYFYAGPDQTNLIYRVAWPNDEMNVLGHNDIGP